MIKYIAPALAGIALLCLVPIVAMAAECPTRESAKVLARSYATEGGRVAYFEGATLQAFLKNYNNQEPRSSLVSDFAITIQRPNSPFITVWLLSGSGKCWTINFNEPRFNDIMGEPA
jgi:hypothetical protein